MREIERKFLLNCSLDDVLCRHEHTRHRLEQHYLPKTGEWTIRARKQDFDYFLTMKKRETDRTCFEIETPITSDHYDALVGHASTSLSKVRHVLFHDGNMWEIDLFEHGLVLAEIELTHEEDEFAIPEWLGEEVTHDKNYRSKVIAKALTESK